MFASQFGNKKDQAISVMADSNTRQNKIPASEIIANPKR